MAKRIFIAVPISEELQKGILEWEKDFQSRFSLSKGQKENRGSSMAWPSGPVRWLSGKNLHITIVPPWYEDNIDKIAGKLKKVALKFEPFGIVFKRINYGPDPKKPHLIWAENMPSKKMIELKDESEKAMGTASDYHRWTMHLTLARFGPETFSSFPVKKLDEIIYWPEKVDSLVIMESHLNPVEAEYETLEEVKF